MSIEAQIIDQRVSKIARDRQEAFSKKAQVQNNEDKLKSIAFVFLVLKTLFDLGEAEAMDCIVDGADDFGIDGVHIGAIQGGEFPVTLLQGKYKRRLDNASAFPEGGVVTMIAALNTLFDPAAKVEANMRLAERLRIIHNLIDDGYLPRVAIVLCNNGQKWSARAQRCIDQSPHGREVERLHIGPSDLVQPLRPAVRIDATLQLTGTAMV